MGFDRMMRGHSVRSLATLGASCLSFAAATAIAQDQAPPSKAAGAANIGQDIVVTARRREESLQSVPLSVTAATPTILKEQRIISAQDIQNLAPSLSLTSRSGQQQSGQFNVRGQGQTFGGALPSVIAYFADVPLESQGGAAFALYDIDSVQVLRGPQGTLFGRNTNGGAVLLTPTAPGDDFGGYLNASYGNLDAIDLRGAVNLPVSETLRLRVSGNMIRRDGYVKNLSGRDFNDQHQDSWRVFLRFEPSDDFRNDLVYTGLDADEGGSAFILSIIRPGKITSTYDGGRLLTALAQQQQWGPRRVSNTQEGLGASRTIHLIADTARLELGNVTLKNIAAFERVKVNFGSDTDGTDVRYAQNGSLPTVFSIGSGVKMYPDMNLRQFTEEFQVSGTVFDNRLEYIAGAFYLDAESPGGLHTFRAGRVGNTGSSPTTTSSNFVTFQFRDRSKAVFTQATYHAGAARQFSITAGLRYSWDIRKSSFGRLAANGPINRPLPLSGYTCSLPGIGNSPSTPASQCYRILTGKYEDVGYSFSLDWKAVDGLLLYATTRRGFKDGGFNTIIASANDPEYQPEVVTDYEIGAKWTYDLGPVLGRLNVDAFTSKYEDIQRQITGGLPTTAVILNVGNGRIKGIEAEGLIQISEFSLSAFYAYLKATYDGGFIDAGVDVSASKFIGVPSHSGGFTARWAHDLSDRGDALIASATVYATSRIALDSDTVLNHEGFAPGYATLGARLEWRRVGGKDFDLALWSKNLTDKLYAVGGVPQGSSSGMTTFLYGEPRTYGVQMTTRF
ncbi:TonB-dependent receptor [Sphingobium sp. TKS]|uniref:TonB-dependent receptor n=1 Tax=Sphingobium sp. TKS TaxID=1315974 RepID=UPI00077015B6|nr:TonB-dependent receptor [Sphingobium sp. TKS]AMK25599.1 TonB-dependent receptor [Sphingobium sp. TKS]